MSPTAGRSLIIVASLIIIAAGIKAAEEVMVPFLLAAFIATIAATPVFWLEHRKVPLGIAITTVMLLIVVTLFGLGALVAQSVTEFTDKLPFYQGRLDALVVDASNWLAAMDVEIPPNLFEDYINVGVALDMAGNTLRGLSGALSNGFLILLTVIFILSEASSFPRKLGDVLKNPGRDLPHFELFAVNVNRYMAIKTTVSAATGIIIGTYLAVLGVDFPLLWGLLAFLLNYVPTIGSIIASVPAVILALVQLGPGYALLTVGGFVVTNVVMGNAVEPRFMGRGLGLSTLVVFLSLVFWGWMLGPVGMLLSVPLTMTAKIALEANPSTEWLAHLLGPAEVEELEAPAEEEQEAVA